MGGGVKNSNDEPVRIVAVDNGENTEQGNRSRGSSTTDSATSSGGNGGRGRGRGGNEQPTDTSTTTSGEQKEIVSELAILNDKEKEQYQNADEKEKKRILRNAKRRERYAKQKGEPKPKKVNKKSGKSDEIDRTQINAVISGLTTAIASRPNCQHWMMTNEEIDSITKPLCNMLKESEIFEKTLEHSNEIALVTACMTVFAPRIFTTVLIEKEKNKHVKPTRKTTENKKPTERNDSGNADVVKDSSVDGMWLGSALY